jgi:uncharacterized protein with PQ loop repeat
MQHQHHHPHLRKRSSGVQNMHPYPSRIFKVAIVDVLVYVVSIASPILTLPQVYEIYANQNAAGVSAISWGAYTLFTIPWFAYGVVHKEKVLIFNNSIWIFLNAAVFVGAILY